MNIQQIKYVIAVDELQSFSQAAEQCHITQSTLSTMVARFEEELGIIIFDRKTKPITSTKEGQQIIKQLKIIIKEIYNLNELASAMKGGISGELKIGVIPTVAPYLLPLFLKDFVAKFPNVHFSISEMTTEKIMDMIEKRDLDIGILSTPLGQSNLLEIPLYNESFLLYDRLQGQSADNLTINDIDFNRLWLLEEGHCMRTQVENICGISKKRTKNSNLEYKSGTIDTLMKFVNKNNGITLIPYLATHDLSKKEQQHLRSFKEPVPVRTIGLVTHQHFIKKEMLALLTKEIIAKVEVLLDDSITKQQVILPV